MKVTLIIEIAFLGLSALVFYWVGKIKGKEETKKDRSKRDLFEENLRYENKLLRDRLMKVSEELASLKREISK